MAPPAGTLRVGRYFMSLLAILIALYAIVFWPGTSHKPKLGLDLVGGTQVVFTAKTPNDGGQSRSTMAFSGTWVFSRHVRKKNSRPGS